MKDRKTLRNPFLSDVVTGPEQSPPADVPTIHGRAFDLCMRDYEVVAQEHLSWSVLLHGEAGCGKTHLLSRFRRWLSAEMSTKSSTPPAVLVAIRMETAPSQIWRHVRRRFAEALTRRAANGVSPLDGILERFAANSEGDVREAIEAADIRNIGQELTKVLEHFKEGRHRPLCRAWLAGEGLSDTDLQLLNLSPARPEEIDEEFGEEVSRRVVLAITRLASPSPVVFCFDQVEALGIAQQGTGNFAPFSRMGATLVDGANNVLLISTVLLTFVRALEDGSMRSDYQRVSKSIMELQPLDLKQGRALIDSRLSLIPELEEENPIPDESLRAFYAEQHGRCNARRLIHEARKLFADWQKLEPPVPTPMPEFLQAEFEQRWANAAIRKGTEQTNALLAHGLPVAFELLGKKTAGMGGRVTVGEGGSRVDIVFLNQPSMQGLASALRNLLKRQPADKPLCLVRDQRLPISATATLTKQRLKEFEASGGRVVRVEAEALAALDAMRQLLTAATSGDLSSNGETVDAKTVREWLAQNLPQEVHGLVAALVGEEKPFDGAADALLELMEGRKVMSAAEAAQAISWTRERIEEYARTHPLVVRWFGGVCSCGLPGG